MKILVTGATGFVGKVLLKVLQKRGHDIVVLTRNVEAAGSKIPVHCRAHEWDPAASLPPNEALDGVEAVVHLAGENIAGGRWTARRKRMISDSRVISTRHLVQAMERMDTKPRVFVSASAIGIYGDAGDSLLTEESPLAEGFLAEVCKDWENEIFKAKNSGIRTVALRTGVVLGNDGGAMDKMLPPFRMGLGGPLGNGRQWMSWIHILDLAHMYIHAIENDSVEGAYNAVSPQPEQNTQFTKTLGECLNRPAILPVPGFALKLVFGEMAEILLASQKVSAEKIINTGFVFGFPELPSALKEITEHPYHQLEMEQWVPQSVEKTFSFFKEAGNLELLTPDFLGFKVLKQSTEPIEEGTRIDYRLSLRGIPMRWQSLITDWKPNAGFSDIQVKGPYSHWHHTHEFEAKDGGTLIRDRVLYKVPFGTPGDVVAHPFIQSDLHKIFNHRRNKVRELFG